MLGGFLAIGKLNCSSQARRGAGIWTVLVAAVALWTGAAHADTVTSVGDDEQCCDQHRHSIRQGLLLLSNTNGTSSW